MGLKTFPLLVLNPALFKLAVIKENDFPCSYIEPIKADALILFSFNRELDFIVSMPFFLAASFKFLGVPNFFPLCLRAAKATLVLSLIMSLSCSAKAANM